MREPRRRGYRACAVIAAVAFVLISAAPEATAAQCQLMIASRPPGATVHVDGEERGKTPLVLSDLKPGSHTVMIALEGHLTSTKRIRLRPGAKTHFVELKANAPAEPEPEESAPGPDRAGEVAGAGHREDVGRPEAGSPGRRAGMLDGKARAAVDAALEWLVSVQEADGHWDGERRFAPRDVGQDTDPGVTGLALLALMGGGHSETEGAHAGAVKRGVKWLISQQAASGEIGGGYGTGRGYNHAIAGLALAEAAVISRSPETLRAVRKAVRFAMDAAGLRGWRYRPGAPGDVSVTAWYVLLCQAAKRAGLRVDGRAFQSALGLLDTCAKPDGTISYQPERSGTPTMTAAGLLCYELLGWKKTDRKITAAADHLVARLPAWEGGNVCFYYWYHGTHSLYHIGGEGWERWNRALHGALLPNQRTGDGEPAGSWHPVGAWCGSAGRVYATAMAALCLEAPSHYPCIYE
ncbi:MAG: PEGA domain-containing protein [Planctomycetota bacterium]|jgi:hypothetical protein